MLRKILPILLIFSILVNPVLADDKVVNVVKGETVPFSGVLLPPAKAEEMKAQLIERDTLKLYVTSYEKSIDLYKANEVDYNRKIKLISEQNDNLAKNLSDSRSVSEWTRFGYFMLGVVGTVAAGYGIKKATQ